MSKDTIGDIFLLILLIVVVSIVVMDTCKTMS